MREKKNWLIITFENTTDAIMMEREAKTKEAPGRIIPLPSQISAGCGLAWRAEPGCRGELVNLMSESGISFGEVVELEY